MQTAHPFLLFAITVMSFFGSFLGSMRTPSRATKPVAASLPSPFEFTPADVHTPHLLGDTWQCPPGGCINKQFCYSGMVLGNGEFCDCAWPKTSLVASDNCHLDPDKTCTKNIRGMCLDALQPGGIGDDNILCSSKEIPRAVAKGAWKGLLCPS
jgi:hypothetical protein